MFNLDVNNKIIKRDKYVEDRATSGDLSIGIGLMMESVLELRNKVDNKREIPQKVDLKKYNIHAFNSLTMLREAVTSMANTVVKPNNSEALKKMNTTEFIIKYKRKELINIVKDDMNLIFNLYNGSGVIPVLYFPTYTLMYTRLNKGKEIKPTKKVDEINLYFELSKELYDNKTGLLCSTLKVDKPIKSENKLLITTSFPIDFHLLSGDLLETHTGKLKDKHKLNTKFKPIPNVDLSNIPFNQTTHRIFGDNTLIAPLPMPLRREVIEVSLKKKWNTHTSEELIKEQTKSILK